MNDNNIFLSIIIPCFNEEKNIPVLIKQILDILPQVKFNTEILLIDDGSSDSTWEQIQLCSNKHSIITAIKHDLNMGIAAAWKTGCENAKGNYILTTDADLQYSPKDIITLINNLSPEYSIIQGWRYEYKNTSCLRIFLSRLFGKILNFCFNMTLNDNKSGFVIYKKEDFRKILSLNKKFKYFQHYIMIIAKLYDFKIKEVPVTFYDRNAGQSYIKFPLLFGLKALKELIYVIKLYKYEWRKI